MAFHMKRAGVEAVEEVVAKLKEQGYGSIFKVCSLDDTEPTIQYTILDINLSVLGNSKNVHEFENR